MRNRIYRALVIAICTFGLYFSCLINSTSQEIKQNSFAGSTLESNQYIDDSKLSISAANINTVSEPINIDRLEMVGELDVDSTPLIFPESYYDSETETYREEEFWDDMELVALVCVAESEGESELGKRLVIDTIFNRAESPYYPNTLYGVIYDNSQYSCVWDGRLERVEYDEYIANLVMEELNNRTNSDVIYFKTDGYFGFGTPILKEGNHYFSGR